MSRLEAFMVALGMILLGMAAARAEEPKLPEIVRGSGPETRQVSAPVRPAPQRAAASVGCEDVVFFPALADTRPMRRAGAGRPARSERGVRVMEGRVPPAFGQSPVSTSGR
jgi:hypothetical protein